MDSIIFFPSGECEVKISEFNPDNIQLSKESDVFAEIKPEDFNISFEFEMVNSNPNAIRRMFCKLPRKLKKKIIGTRSYRRRHFLKYILSRYSPSKISYLGLNGIPVKLERR